MKLRPSPYANLTALVLNLLLAYAAYMLCRVVFVLETLDLYRSGWAQLSMWNLFMPCWCCCHY